MKSLKPYLGIVLAVIFSASCTSVSTSKSTGESLSAGYTSARLAKPEAQLHNDGPEGSAEVHDAIQRTIRNRFKTRGMIFGTPNADLIVAYMFIHRENGSATMNSDYFGVGRNANAILEEARQRGTITNTQPDAFQSGTLVIDILDAKTNQLIYRGATKRALLDGVKPIERNARINETVAQTLAPFFDPQ